MYHGWRKILLMTESWVFRYLFASHDLILGSLRASYIFLSSLEPVIFRGESYAFSQALFLGIAWLTSYHLHSMRSHFFPLGMGQFAIGGWGCVEVKMICWASPWLLPISCSQYWFRILTGIGILSWICSCILFGCRIARTACHLRTLLFSL